MTTAKKTFLQKIAAASAKMENPKKRATNPHFNSKYANLQGTMDVIEPVLEDVGLSHMCYFDGTVIIYRVYDAETEEGLSSMLDLKDILAGLDKNPWQGIGQAFTYLRRYLAQAFWGLVPEDTDAQDAPSRPAAQRKTQASKLPNQEATLAGDNRGSEEHNGGGAL